MLLASAIGVVRITRGAPCPGLTLPCLEDATVTTAVSGPLARRAFVSCWAEKAPEFAACVMARLLPEDG